MKRLLLFAGFMFIASYSHAGNVFIDHGETMIFSKVTVSTTAVSTLSSYGGSRLRLMCRNTGSIEVYVGSSTAVTSQGATAFELSPSTGTGATFVTENRSALFGIAHAEAAGTAAQNAIVTCIEERN